MSEMKTIYLKDYKKPEFEIKDVELVFELSEDSTTVTNVMNFVKVDESVKDIELDSIDLELLELWLNDLKLKETRYVYADEKLKILNVPSEFRLKIKYILKTTLNLKVYINLVQFFVHKMSLKVLDESLHILTVLM